ncbi:hypothetical protein PoB_001247200 [Plakobranchus ocellatus]|uniref:Uncharacterized protein n=1 Tax=Plakobranchus ocellatus TaxID=259542 RepID=A0AAV3YSQ4_9GAST|nr:hypothetical protein PoB_001247200 [Plakobranchus ocellatus]
MSKYLYEFPVFLSCVSPSCGPPRFFSHRAAILNSPQILLAEEEKIFDESEQQERHKGLEPLEQLLERLKANAVEEQRKLRLDLEEERRCRRKLELLVKQQVSKLAAGSGTDTDGSASAGPGVALQDSAGTGPPPQHAISTQDGGAS